MNAIDQSVGFPINDDGATETESTPSTVTDNEGTESALDTGTEPAANTAEGINYEELMESDLAELKQEFAELKDVGSITELKNPLRYAALRDMGLTPTEAYLATAGKRRSTDTRGHLVGSIPRAAGGPPSSMSKRELDSARELFSGLTDSQIQQLYRRVTQ